MLKTIITQQPKNHKAADGDGDEDGNVNDDGFHDSDYDGEGIKGYVEIRGRERGSRGCKPRTEEINILITTHLTCDYALQ